VYTLQKKIDTALSSLFKKEQRFMGHITIARVKKVKEREQLLKYLKQVKGKSRACTIKAFALKQSTLTEKKAVYTTLEEFKCNHF